MAKNNKASTHKTSEADSSLADFVTALAQSTASSNVVPCKAERIAKRQAKRQRKEQAHNAAARAQKKQKQQEKKQAAVSASKNRQTKRQEQLLTRLNRIWEALVAIQAEHSRYSPPVQTSDRKPRNFPHNVQHKKMKTSLEPRKSDYGGLGLARPTLYLPFADPSWQPRLQQAFAEHIPGWSGKPPMMQAMKKQRDVNLLWKRLQREKESSSRCSNNGNNKKQKAMRHLTPDERVEAMLKAGDLV